MTAKRGIIGGSVMLAIELGGSGGARKGKRYCCGQTSSNEREEWGDGGDRGGDGGGLVLCIAAKDCEKTGIVRQRHKTLKVTRDWPVAVSKKKATDTRKK